VKEASSFKVLYVATSDIHLNVFHIPYLRYLKERGCHLDVAVEIRGNGQVPYADRVFNLPFKRTLFSLQLVKAYKKLKRLLEEEDYDLVHCHTPIPAALTRIAKRNLPFKSLELIYTAHGFHFYKGCTWWKYQVFFQVEKYLSKFTDVLITINQEDYQVACEHFLAKKNVYLKGIGVDESKFHQSWDGNKSKLRKELSLKEDGIYLLYVANFIPRKNHRFLIESFKLLVEKKPEAKLLLAGSGRLMQKMNGLVRRLNLEDSVTFLGFRKDINLLLQASDLSVSTSLHEGLGLSLTEAMFTGVPIIATEDRGHKEMIQSGYNGFLFRQGDKDQFIQQILELFENPKLKEQMVERSKNKAGEFKLSNSLITMHEVYNENLFEPIY
jgi:glycosyltransferase EpsD